MDSLTHTVLGACLGEIIAGKKIGRKAMLIGAIANNIPDADVVTSFWMDKPDSLLAHRGFLHSILFMLLAAPLLSYACKKFFKKTDLTFNQWLSIIGNGMAIHIFLDSCTTYGTGLLEPFSHVRVTFNTLFILDPVILLTLLASTIAMLFLKRNPEKQIAVAQRAIMICSIYLLINISIKLYVNSIVKENIAEQKIAYEKFTAAPAPLSSLLWYAIIKTNQGYYTGYYSLFDKDKHLNLNFLERNDSLMSQDENNPKLLKLLRFSNGYYCYEKRNDTVILNDMRFGQANGWTYTDAPFVFRFYLTKPVDNELKIEQTPMEKITGEAFTSLYARIIGKK